MDDRTVDKVFAGHLDNLPSVSSKIVRIFTSSTFTGESDFSVTKMSFDERKKSPTELSFRIRHYDGKKYSDGRSLPKAEGILSRKARNGISGIDEYNFFTLWFMASQLKVI